MEDSSCTDDTLALYRELREDGLDNVGIVLQRYLRRTLDDIASLVDLTPNVRLCKGIYVEPLKIAYHDFDQVRSNFVRALEALLAGGSYVGIATHDEWLLTEGAARSRARPGERRVRVPDVAGRPRGPGRSARRRRPPAADLRPLRGAVVRLLLRRLQENPKIAATSRPTRSAACYPAETVAARAAAERHGYLRSVSRATVRRLWENLDPNDRFRERRRAARKRKKLRRTAGGIALLLAATAVAVGARGLDSGDEPAAKPTAKKAVKTEAARPFSASRGDPRRPRDDGARVDSRQAPGVHLDARTEHDRARRQGRERRSRFPHPRSPARPADRIGDALLRPQRGSREPPQAGDLPHRSCRVLRRPDPVQKRPDLAIRTTGGGVWVNHAGLGWTNPYDKRVWNYNLDVAKAAVRAGFDEIQFDYVRFPSDGPIESAVFRGKRREPMATTIAQFVHYATNRLRPMGARVSVDLFGLSARRNLGVGQSPRRLSKIVDSISQWSIPLTTVPANTGLRVRSRPRERPSDDRCETSADRCAAAGHARSVARGLQLSGATTLAHVKEQIRAARRWKAGGFLLWNPSGNYTTGALTTP